MQKSTIIIVIFFLIVNICFAQENQNQKNNLLDSTNLNNTKEQIDSVNSQNNNVKKKSSDSIPSQKSKPEINEAKISSIEPQLYLAYGIAVLSIFIACVSIFISVKEKKRFRDNVLNLLSNDEGERMKSFISKITRTAIATSSLHENSTQTYKIDEQQFRQLFEVYWTSKNSVTNAIKQNEQVNPQPQNLPISLYAEVIKENGFFYRFSEQPTSDSIFELKLDKASASIAKVTIYKAAHELVKQRPEFLEGCDLQSTGNSHLTILQEGIASKEGDGWRMKIDSLKVKIS